MALSSHTLTPELSVALRSEKCGRALRVAPTQRKQASLFCTPAALDLQVDCADVRLQGAGRPERDAFAVK